MMSLASENTLDTQKVSTIKRRLLGYATQSDSVAQTPAHNVEQVLSRPHNSSPRAPALSALSKGSTNLPFAFASQTHRRADQSQEQSTTHAALHKHKLSGPSSNHDQLVASTMHYTFAGFPETTGDTQPMDTQTFVQHSDLGLSRSILDAHNGTTEEQCAFIADSEAARQVASRIDLTENGGDKLYEERDEDVSSLLSDEVDLSPGTNTRLEDLFKTPAPVSRKRNYRGELVSSDNRTSSTRAPESALKALKSGIHGATNDISMTQLFQTTQLGTSPVPNALHSDPAFDRPSPGLNLTSPTRRTYTSSPIRPSTSDGSRGNQKVLDPVVYERTSKESQESRARRLLEQEQQRMRDNLEVDADSWNNSWDIRQENLLRQRDRQQAISAIELSAPVNRTTKSSISKPSPSLDNIPSDVTIPTSVVKSVMPRGETPEPVFPDAAHVGQQKKKSILAQARVDVSADVQVPMTSSKPLQKSQASRPLPPSPSTSSSQHANELLSGYTQQTVAVQDSQSDPQHKATAVDEVDGHGVQSSDASNQFIQQSQYSNVSFAKEKEVGQLSSALPAETPKPSIVPLIAGSEIPSSPPIHFSEHDYEYDEHDADEAADPDDDDEDDADEDDVDEHGANVEVDSTHQADASTVMKSVIKDDDHTTPKLLSNSIHTNRLVGPKTHKQTIESANTRIKPNANDAGETASKHTGTTSTDEMFETAQTNQTPRSGRSKMIMELSQQISEISPIKGLIDIADQASPRHSGDLLDLDFVNNLVSDGDKEFYGLVSGSSPVRPTKKRRLQRGKLNVIHSSNQENQTTERLAELDKNQTAPSGREEPKSPTTDAQSAAMAESRIVEVTAVSLATTQAREADGAKFANQFDDSVASRQLAVTTGGRNGTNVRLRTYQRKRARLPATMRRQRSKLANDDANTEHSGHVNDQQADGTLQALDAAAVSVAVANHACVPNRITSVPTRVLALFKDARLYYYPATYIETLVSDGGEKYKVKFDDDTLALLDPVHVRRFELVVGDIVKVDLSGLRKGTYSIRGFSGASTVPLAFSSCVKQPDASGYEAIQLIPKTTEGSTPTVAPDRSLVVPVSSIYLTRPMISAFEGRHFKPSAKPSHRLATPSTHASEPSTPSSRSRRFTTSVHGQRPELVTLKGSDLFLNMSFAVTFVNDQSKMRDEATRLITSNGGSLFEEGFEAVFITDPSAFESPKKLPAQDALLDPTQMKKICQLRPSAKGMGFTALIADRHCRTEKYLQALALGIPCLHPRWLKDCVEMARILPFDRYLLPSGESEFIGNAVRSRILVSYDPLSAEASLQNVLARRTVPFDGAHVLLILLPSNKRKVYQFLLSAAGAANVVCVRDLDEAKKHLQSSRCHWAICDGDKVKVEEALSVREAQSSGKRRKRNSDANLAANIVDLKIADCEFVVQSLILGGLADV